MLNSLRMNAAVPSGEVPVEMTVLEGQCSIVLKISIQIKSITLVNYGVLFTKKCSPKEPYTLAMSYT